MTIYIPRIFGLEGDPEKIKYTSQNICAMAEQKSDKLIAYVDGAGEGHITYKVQETTDANLVLTFYSSVDDNFQSVACTYTTAAAICNALGIGTAINYDEAIRFTCKRNSIFESIVLLPLFTYANKFEGDIKDDSEYNICFFMMESLDNSQNKEQLYECCLKFRLMYMSPDFMRPLLIEPYDRITVVENKQCIIFGDVPPEQLRYKDDMMAAIFNSIAITYYYTSTKSNAPEVDYKNCAILLRRAFHMAASLAAKSWIFINLEELKWYCKDSQAYDFVLAVYSELSHIIEKLVEEERRKSMNTTQPMQPRVSQTVTPSGSDISDKEMMTKYLAFVYQNEVQRYRLSEQISSLSGMKFISDEELAPFYESKSTYDYHNNRISEQELFLNNKADFEKWSMSYLHIKKNEVKLAAQKEYCLATAEQLRQLHQRTGEVLQKLYACNVIPKKYQTLVAVSTLFEYFQNGRVDSLKEAINLFEQEVRQQIVIDGIQNLNETVKGMQQSIIKNQQMLYTAVCDTNASIQTLSNEISSLSEAYVQNADKSQELMNESIAQSNIIAKETAAIRDSAQWIAFYRDYFTNIK